MPILQLPFSILRRTRTHTSRRFPPPWMIEEHRESFIVRDANGQALGYFYL